jgi:hypothetical protein
MREAFVAKSEAAPVAMHAFPMSADGAGAQPTVHKPMSIGSNTSSFENTSTQMRTPPQQHVVHTPPQGIGAQPLGLSQQQLQLQQQQRSVKRPRPVKSCTECRKRKLRCSQCQKSSRVCKYAADHDPANLSDASDTEPIDTNRPNKRSCPPGTANSNNVTNNDTATTPAKNGGSPGLPMLEELTLRMDRLERHMHGRSPAPTDTSGGRILYAAADTVSGLSVKGGGTTTRFFGQHSPRVMLNVVRDDFCPGFISLWP